MDVAFILKMNGVIEAMPKREPTLEECQKIVGGYIQVIEIAFLNNPGQMVMDEEGKLKGYGVNPKATAIASNYSGIADEDYIVGDVIILMGRTRLT